jgi:hypothetical protein
MSDPDFDPAIERAYRVTPEFADSALFDAEVAVRLESRWRWRRAILAVLGLSGAFLVLNQFVKIQIAGLFTDGSLGRIVAREERSEAFATVKQLSGQLGLADVSLGALSGPYILILFGAALTIALGFMAVQLSKSL